jgi:hypothetical protein
MKNILIIAMAILLALPSCSSLIAQETKTQDLPGNTLTVNPLGLIIGLVDGQYEMRLDPGSSLGIRGTYFGFKIGDWSYTAFGGGAAYRMYPKQTALEGLYWGPTLVALMAQIKYDNSYSEGSANWLTIVPGLELGNQWVWDSGIVLDLGVGISYYTVSAPSIKTKDKISGIESNETVSGTGLSGIGYGVRLAFGFCF